MARVPARAGDAYHGEGWEEDGGAYAGWMDVERDAEMIYTHVAIVGAGVKSPADLLDISDPAGL